MADREALHRQLLDEAILINRSHFDENGEPDWSYYALRDCPLCGETEYRPRFKNQLGNQFVECRSCTMVFMSPAPNPAEVLSIYTDSLNKTLKAESWKNKLKDFKPATQPRVSERYELLLKHSNRGKLLDFGCGLGNLTDELKFHFDEVQGVEIDSYCAGKARKVFGLTVHNDSLQKMAFENEFDVCTSNNSLEHVCDPWAIVGQLQAALKPGGLLYIECPNVDSVSMRIFRGLHHQSQSNEHLNLFAASTLGRLVEAHGMRVIEARSRRLDCSLNDLLVFLLRRGSFCHRGSPQLGGSRLYSGITYWLDRLALRAFKSRGGWLSTAGTYVQVVARKPANG